MGIIKFMKSMAIMAAGIGAGMLYSKYNKDVMKFMKKSTKSNKVNNMN